MQIQLILSVFLAAAFPTVTALVGIVLARNESKDIRNELTAVRERLARVEEKLNIAG